MTSMIAEVYDALRESGASEEKARRAAEAMSTHADRFGDVERRFDGLERKIDLSVLELERKIDQSRAELDRKIDQSYAELERKIDQSHAELDRKIDQSHAELERKIDQSRVELDRKIDHIQTENGVRFERIEGKLVVVNWQLALIVGGIVTLVLKAFGGAGH